MALALYILIILKIINNKYILKERSRRQVDDGSGSGLAVPEFPEFKLAGSLPINVMTEEILATTASTKNSTAGETTVFTLSPAIREPEVRSIILLKAF